MQLKKFVFSLSLVALMASISFAQDFKYIGAQKCKMCHNSEKSGQQYKIWSESLHAKALVSLSNEKSMEYAKANNIADPAKEPKCLKCHSTAASVDKSLVETMTIEEGVSCESCHGPGSVYKDMKIMKSRELSMKNGLILPTKEVCEGCHNEENPFHKPFDFNTAIKKVGHPKPAAE